MSDTADYFQAIGRKLQERLGNHTDPASVFADIATGVLHELQAPRIDVVAMADWLAEQRPLPRQVNFDSGFGQPPLVVFEAPGFYVEVLFWFPSRTSIHGHGFTGAFRVLNGYSVQVEYRFEQTAAPEESVLNGRLVPESIEMVAPGRICPIHREDEFIHTVAHMGNPSLTLVARTYGMKDFQQFTYHRCGYAHISHLNKHVVARQVDVFDALFKARPDAAIDRLIEFLAASDSPTFFKITSQMPFRVTLPVFSTKVMPRIRERFAQSRPLELAAVDEIIASHGLWGMVTLLKEPRKQLLVALSELFPNVQDRDALIRRSFNVDDAGPVLEDWLSIADRSAS